MHACTVTCVGFRDLKFFLQTMYDKLLLYYVYNFFDKTAILCGSHSVYHVKI